MMKLINKRCNRGKQITIIIIFMKNKEKIHGINPYDELVLIFLVLKKRKNEDRELDH